MTFILLMHIYLFRLALTLRCLGQLVLSSSHHASVCTTLPHIMVYRDMLAACFLAVSLDGYHDVCQHLISFLESTRPTSLLNIGVVHDVMDTLSAWAFGNKRRWFYSSYF